MKIAPAPSNTSALATIVLVILGLYSHATDAFCASLDCYHGTFGSAIPAAATHNDEAAVASPRVVPVSRVQGSGSRSSIHSHDDVARVWANSLQGKIPWHAGSKRYLSNGSHPVTDQASKIEEQQESGAAAARPATALFGQPPDGKAEKLEPDGIREELNGIVGELRNISKKLAEDNENQVEEFRKIKEQLNRNQEQLNRIDLRTAYTAKMKLSKID